MPAGVPFFYFFTPDEEEKIKGKTLCDRLVKLILSDDQSAGKQKAACSCRQLFVFRIKKLLMKIIWYRRGAGLLSRI